MNVPKVALALTPITIKTVAERTTRMTGGVRHPDKVNKNVQDGSGEPTNRLETSPWFSMVGTVGEKVTLSRAGQPLASLTRDLSSPDPYTLLLFPVTYKLRK